MAWTDAQYADLKRYLEVFVRTIHPQWTDDPSVDPIVALSRVEATGRGAAHRGLRATLPDIQSMVACLPEPDRARLDAALAAASAPRVGQVKALLSVALARIIKRGAISSEKEALLVKSLLEDTDSVADADAKSLRRWLAAYEGLA